MVQWVNVHPVEVEKGEDIRVEDSEGSEMYYGVVEDVVRDMSDYSSETHRISLGDGAVITLTETPAEYDFKNYVTDLDSLYADRDFNPKQESYDKAIEVFDWESEEKCEAAVTLCD